MLEIELVIVHKCESVKMKLHDKEPTQNSAFSGHLFAVRSAEHCRDFPSLLGVALGIFSLCL